VGINCPPVAGCTGNFPLGTLVTLTAVASQGSQVGGWSSNCTPFAVPPPTTTTQTCQITMNTNSAGQPANEAVGAIFNLTPPTPDLPVMWAKRPGMASLLR
jgi:hypothetical protein